MDITTKTNVITTLIDLKKQLNDIMKDRLYIKNFDDRLIQYLCEVDDLKMNINAEIIQVIFY